MNKPWELSNKPRDLTFSGQWVVRLTEEQIADIDPNFLATMQARTAAFVEKELAAEANKSRQ